MDEELKKDVDELKKTVKDIKETVNNIEKLEESEIKNILNVKDMESKELSNLDNLEDLENKELSHLHELKPKKFKDVNSWKSMIWDDCEEKIMNNTEKIVTFMCKLTKKVCSFEVCPKNNIKSDPD